MYDVCALGEILIDFTPNGISAAGRKLFEQNPGGAPANVLASLNKLGANTAFIGKVGNDMHGLFLKETLEEAGIDTSGLVTDPCFFTTLAFVSLNEKGERSFSFARKPGADTMLKKEELNHELLKSCRIFHIGSLSLTDQPSRGATLAALEEATKAGAIISYDPNYRASLWPTEEDAVTQMRSILPFIQVMKLSDEETLLLTDCAEPSEAAASLVEKGIPLVAVTLGAKGAYVCTKDGGAMIPGFASKAVDTTGAGDSFWGGFLYQLIQSGKRPDQITLAEAGDFARFANAVASLCVEQRGAILAMPDLEAVMERLSQIADL